MEPTRPPKDAAPRPETAGTPKTAKSTETSAFERLGGETGLWAIMDAFVDRVVGDTMIGFFFRSVDIPQLKRFEYEFAAGHLGGPVRYTGRPLGRAHAAHPILGGQFNRRLKILENTLRDFSVPEDIISDWLAHNARLRSVITRDLGGECALPEAPPKAPPSPPASKEDGS